MPPRVRLAFEQTFAEVAPFLAGAVALMLLCLIPQLPGFLLALGLAGMVALLVLVSFRVAVRWRQLESEAAGPRSFIPLESLDLGEEERE